MPPDLGRKAMGKPYFYVRFRWLHGIDLNEAARDLSKGFDVEFLNTPEGDIDLTLYKDHREELKVSADTLKALLSPTRAVLSQREEAPFTARDMDLRRKVLELYPRSRITPFPLLFSDEPKFEVADTFSGASSINEDGDGEKKLGS